MVYKDYNKNNKQNQKYLVVYIIFHVKIAL